MSWDQTVKHQVGLDSMLPRWRYLVASGMAICNRFRSGALRSPRSLALPDWDTLMRLAAALIDQSADHYAGWGEVITFTACTAVRIGGVSGVRKADIDQ